MINVNILGTPSVSRDGVAVSFPYKKVEGVFYYLCFHKNTTRQALIHTLWGDNDETAGRKSLREAIYRIKKLFGADFIVTTGNFVIGINPDVPLVLDWDTITPTTVLTHRQHRVFAHFFIKNSYEFDQWVEDLQGQYRQTYLDAARTQIMGSSDISEDAVNCYRTALIHHDPYNEDAYCQVLNHLLKSQKWAWAISFYQDLESSLQKELDVPPAPETQAFLVRALHGSKQQETTIAPTFFGRQAELTALSSTLKHFASGETVQSVAFTGEAGVGKSKLLERARQVASRYDLLVLSTTAFRNEGDFLLKIWFDLFRNISTYVDQGTLSPDQLGECYHHLNTMLNGDQLLNLTSNSMAYHSVSHQLYTLMANLASRHRVVIFLDDLQWMDTMSTALLCRILAGFPDDIILVSTFLLSFEYELAQRLDPLFYADLLAITKLQGFTFEETMQYISLSSPDFSPEDAQKIFDRSGGNPFYLTELILYYKKHGNFDKVPPRITGLLKTRLSQLSPLENETLDCLSIFSERVLANELHQLMNHPLPEVLTVLEELKQKHLVQEFPVNDKVYYNSRHFYLSEYLYQRQGDGRRKARHAKLAEIYKSYGGNPMDYLPLMIYHYGKSGNLYHFFHNRVTYLRQFHSIAYENFPLLRPDVAWEDSLPDPSQGAKELLALGEEILAWQDNTLEGQRLKMEMHYILGRHQISMGGYPSGLDHIEKCASLAVLFEDCVTQTLCCKQLVFYGIQTEQIAVMEENLTKGMALLDPLAEPDQLATYLRLQGVCEISKGNYQIAQNLLDQSVALFRKLETPLRHYSINIAACYGYTGDIALAQGDFSAAITHYQHAIATNAEAVITNGLGQFWVQSALAHIKLKQFTQATEALARGRDCFFPYDCAWGRGRLEILCALVALHDKRYTDAFTHYHLCCSIEDFIQNPTNQTLIEQVRAALAKVRDHS